VSSFQRVIKYFAIAFAVLIIFNLVTSIIYGINMVENIFSKDKTSDGNLEKVDIDDDYSILDIEVTNVDILVKNGDNFKIEKDSDDVRVREVGNKLLITEKDYGLFEEKRESELVVYVPEDYVFDSISIENGAGRVDVDYLKTKEIELDLGAGKVNLNKIDVSDEMSIDGGAGEIIINDGYVNDLDLDMGIGKVELNLSLTGNSEINAGVGEIFLTLLDDSNNYRINVNKGVGTVMIADSEMSDGSHYGDGNNIINIDGGIGNIKVDFR